VSDNCDPETDRLTGWLLGAGSWAFHRSFYARFGRPMEHGEFGFLIDQIRRGAGEQLGEYVYRLTLRGGTPIVVLGGPRFLKRVMRPDWTPETAAPPAKAAAAAPPASPVGAAPEPCSGPIRLSQSSAKSAVAPADRLRRQGVAA
jgi:hypothetical protein